jgi:hypothetical protein
MTTTSQSSLTDVWGGGDVVSARAATTVASSAQAGASEQVVVPGDVLDDPYLRTTVEMIHRLRRELEERNTMLLAALVFSVAMLLREIRLLREARTKT